MTNKEARKSFVQFCREQKESWLVCTVDREQLFWLWQACATEKDKEIEALRVDLAMMGAKYQELLQYAKQKELEITEAKAKLAIAIDAFEAIKECSGTSQRQWHLADEALTKIKGE